jgi:hypothetical protein
MTVIDDFKSDKNKNLIIQASNKMLADKYNISLNPEILLNIINSIITSMSKDAILMNNTIKLMELNTITLAKMKEYVNKNIDTINITNNNIANNITNNNINDNPLLTNNNNQPIEIIGNNVDLNNEEYNSKKEITNEELLIRVKDYENNRIISNSVFTNIENDIETFSQNSTNTNANTTTNTTTNTSIIPEIIEKVLTTINSNINTNINKKTLIINSYSRDWIINPQRNTLSFTINIDLQNNIIEPLKILFPLYVKNITPYIILVITDNHKTFKYKFLYSKTSGNWDIWKLISKDNNINNVINLTNKNWKIHFLDYLNNILDLGKDDIKISNINEYKLNKYENYDNTNIEIDTNIDNILMPQKIIPKKTKKINLYEINIDYSNIIEYDEYNLNILSKYDYLLLKTYSNKYINIKVIEVDNNIGKIIILNENNLMKEDFINSTLLNYRAQYSIILAYYPKNNIT